MLLSKAEFCFFNLKSKCVFIAEGAELTEELLLDTGHRALLYSFKNYFVEMIVSVRGECIQIRPVNLDYINGLYFRDINVMDALGLAF